MSALSSKRLCIHWPGRHVTPERVDKLRAALSAHPGDDDVLVDLQGGNVLVLGEHVRVDASSRDLHRAVRCACQRQVMVHVLDDELLWP